MKKIVILALISVFVLASCQSTQEHGRKIVDIHTTRDSVDWNGTYYGEIPSASGTGIIVRLTLNEDEYYELQYHYNERPENLYTESGPFTWAEDGATITLEGLENSPKYYWVSSGYMIQLDMKGKRITGPLAEKYVLRKEKDD